MFSEYPDVLTVKEAAKALRCGNGSVYGLVRENKIQYMKSGRRILIAKPHLIEYALHEKIPLDILLADNPTEERKSYYDR